MDVNNFAFDLLSAVSQGAGAPLSIIVNTTGMGMTSLNSSNSFSGGLTIKSGYVKFAALTSAGTGTITLGDSSGSSTAQVIGGVSGNITNAIAVATGSTGPLIIGDLIGSGFAPVYTGAVSMANNVTVGSYGSGSTTMSGGLTGSGNLTLATLSTGKVFITSSPVNMTGSITHSGSGAGTATISSVIGTNVNGVTQNATSNLILTGTNTYTAATTITAGTLQIGDGITDGSIASSSGITDNGTLAYNLVGTRTYANTISGTGNLTKTGAGTLILSGTNSFNGGTTISGGTIQLNRATGSLATSSNLTVGSTGTLLGGGGTFNVDNSGATGSLTTALGTLTTGIGDNVITTTRTAAFDQAVTFTSLAARTAGATLSFVNSGGTNSSSNGFVLAGVTANSFIDKGVFYGTGSTNGYAWYDASGYVRALNYGVDGGVNSATSGTTTSLASKTYQQITGALTAQASATFTTFNINGNNDVTLAGGATFQADSILKNGTAGTATISSGTAIKASSGAELVINTASSGDNLVLTTPIIANGTNALTKAGAGTLTLNGANTYTGTTTIAAGTLTVGSAGTLNGGSYSGAIQDYGVLNYASSANQTLGGNISGTGSLTKASTGTLSLTGTNTFSGGIRVNNGTVYASTPTATGTGTITLGSVGGTENVDMDLATGTATNAWSIVAGTGTRTIRNGTGSINLSGPIALNNNLTLDTITSANSFSLTGVVTGSNSNTITIQNTGGGTNSTTIDGNSSATYSGLIQVNTGATLVVGGTGMNFGNSTVNLSGTAKLSASHDGTIAGLNGDSTSQVISGGASKTLTIAGSGNYTYNGVIVADTLTPFYSPSISKTGTGTQTLTGNNTYTGTTAVSAGTLTLSGNNTTSGTVTLSGTGTLVAKNVQALGTSAIVLNTSTTLDLATDTPINPINISTGNLLSGSTTIISDRLTSGLGVNQTLGTLGINNGILNIIKGSNVSGGSPSVAFGNVTLTNTGGVIVTFNPTTASLSLANVNMTTTNNTSQTLVLDGTATGNMITGAISNVGGGAGTGTIILTKSNTSTWTLSGINTYTGGTTVSGGTLALSGAGSTLGASTGSLTMSGGALDLGGLTTPTVGAVSITAAASSGNTIGNGSLTGTSYAASNTTGNAIVSANLLGGSVTLAKSGAGTLTLSGTNTYTGATTLTLGTLNVNSTTALGGATSTLNLNGGTIDNTSGSSITLANNQPITFGGSFAYSTSAGTASNNLNLGTGAVTNGASGRTITLNGAGALTFGGVMTNTLVGANTLTVNNGSGTTSTSAVNFGGYALAALAVNYVDIINGSGNVNITGAVTNGGTATASGLTYSGTGKLTLSGANTYAGATTISSGGTLQIGAGGTTGSLSTSSAITDNGTLIFNRSDTVTQGTQFSSGVISGTGTVIQNGTGTLVLNNASNGYTGGTKLNAGTVSITTGGHLGPIPGVYTANNIDFTGNSSLQMTAGFTFNTLRGITIETGVTGSMEVTGANVVVAAQIIAGSGGALTKTGTGTLTLTGANSYTGLTTVSAGELDLNTTGSQSVVGNLTVSGGTAKLLQASQIASGKNLVVSGGTFDIQTFNQSLANVQLASGNINGTTGILTSANAFDMQSGSVSAILAGSSVALNKTTAGTVTLSGANTYTGATTVGNGTLSFNSVAAGATAQALGKSNTVNLGVASTLSGVLSYTGGAGTLDKNVNALGNGTDTIQNSGTGLLTLTGTLTKNGTTLTLKGGTYGITVSGTGTIAGSSSNSDLIVDGGVTTLATANTYNGPTFIIDGATLNANAANALPTSSGRTAVSIDQTGTGTSTLALGASQSVASLTGASTSKVTLGSNTLTVGTSGGSTTFAGVISGTLGNVTKDGTSTQVFSGNNTYTGTTTVSSGTLLINGDQSAATGNVSVSSTATLGGSGKIGGAVNASGLLAPGNNSIGVLTVASLALNSSSTVQFEINGTATPGTDYDRIVVSGGGALALDGAFTIAFGNLSALANTTDINLFSYSSSHTGDFTSLVSTGYYASAGWTHVGETFSMSYSGQTLTFSELTGNLTVVPEPTTWALPAFSLTTVMIFRRRRDP